MYFYVLSKVIAVVNIQLTFQSFQFDYLTY